jgi:hypothetical protein
VQAVSALILSFWQADRNWFIQQRVWTLSDITPAGPPIPAVDQSSDAARMADQQAALGSLDELKSEAINSLELSSPSGYTSSLASGRLLNRSA